MAYLYDPVLLDLPDSLDPHRHLENRYRELSRQEPSA